MMKKKKPNGQQFKSQMNKLSKDIKKVVPTPKNINDSWESLVITNNMFQESISIIG